MGKKVIWFKGVFSKLLVSSNSLRLVKQKESRTEIIKVSTFILYNHLIVLISDCYEQVKFLN